MNRHHLVLVSLALVGACRSDSVRGPADSVVTGTANRSTARASDAQLEVPQILPATETTLKLVEDRRGRLDEGTTASYRSVAGRLVDAALEDLYRVGRGDDGSLRALGDSAVTLIGGGAGDAPEATPEEVLRSAAMLRRFIASYQQRLVPVED